MTTRTCSECGAPIGIPRRGDSDFCSSYCSGKAKAKARRAAAAAAERTLDAKRPTRKTTMADIDAALARARAAAS